MNNEFGQPPTDSSQSEPPTKGHGKTRDDDKLAAIEARLNALPARQELTLAAALKRLAPAIRRLRGAGYSADDVAAELTRELSSLDMTVSARTLARLVPKPRAKPALRGTDR